MVDTWDNGSSSLEFVENMLDWFYAPVLTTVSVEPHSLVRASPKFKVLTFHDYVFKTSSVLIPPDCSAWFDLETPTVLRCYSSLGHPLFTATCWRGFCFGSEIKQYDDEGLEAYDLPPGLYPLNNPNIKYASDLYSFERIIPSVPSSDSGKSEDSD